LHFGIRRDLKDITNAEEVSLSRSSQDVMAARGSLRDEMAGADLGDARLNARRDRVIAALEHHPDTGFPDACASDAEAEALYRFLRNRRVSLDAVIAPHVQATADRCRAVGEVLVIHDTTENVFPGETPRTGLAVLGPRRHGFWLHAALAVSADGLRAPLGVLGLTPFVRQPDPTRQAKPHWRERFRDPHKESRRWAEGVTTVRTCLGTEASPIHVMDREGDNYELLAHLRQHQERFVVRLHYDRRLSVEGNPDAPATLDAAMPRDALCERPVTVSARQVGTRPGPLVKRRPARATRVATVRFAAAALTLRRPRDHRHPLPTSLAVHVVYASELHPPAGEPPIEWRLVTTEPITTTEEVLRIVEWYRTRWLIEEFFKCLKTGCAYEKRQLESLDTLLVALALLAPIAWQLLLMRHLSRELPDVGATVALTRRQIAVLRATPVGRQLAARPSIRDALRAVARLGGHLRQNGDPGWLVLARGMQKLLCMETGWAAARAAHI
jgi:Transposase DNA-binding/Transposase DDE domain